MLARHSSPTSPAACGRQSPVWIWAAFFATATLLGLLSASQVWIDYTYGGTPIAWRRALAVALIDWYLWALATPLIVWLASRWPFDRRRWGRALLVHIPAGAIVGASKLIVEAVIVRELLGIAPRPVSGLKLQLTLMIYGIIVGARHWLAHAKRARDRELRASQLEAELARTHLQALKMQLHPHFLFNTLNTIAALMREDVEAADVMLTRLSDLLRLALEAGDVQEVPLRQELAFLDRYLDIQRVRFRDRLTVAIDVAPDALDVLVPAMILQPLIENALQHGVAARPGDARVELRARISGDRLELEVRDDGEGPPAVIRQGHGLANTRSRLLVLYGSSATLSLTARGGGGAVARISVPAALTHTPLPPSPSPMASFEERARGWTAAAR